MGSDGSIDNDIYAIWRDVRPMSGDGYEVYRNPVSI